MYSVHPFGGLASHPYGGSMGALPSLATVNLGLGGGSKTAGNILQLNTQALKNQMKLFTKLQPAVMQAALNAQKWAPSAPVVDEGSYAVGGGEPSFFEANKTAILVGGGIAVLLAAVLIMRRK
jgi:hypothetical protein